MEWAREIAILSQGGTKAKSFLIFMPTPPKGIPMPRFDVDVPGKGVNFLGKKIPFTLRFGKKGTKRGGQLFGGGIDMGGRRQLFRMDYGPLADNHGGSNTPKPKAYEHDVWGDGEFHYHVNKWKNQDTSSN